MIKWLISFLTERSLGRTKKNASVVVSAIEKFKKGDKMVICCFTLTEHQEKYNLWQRYII